MIVESVIAMGGTPADIAIVIVGFLFATFVIWRDKQKSKERAMIWDKLENITNEKLSAIHYQYAQVVKLTYAMSVVIKHRLGVELLNESANSEGDSTLNRKL